MFELSLSATLMDYDLVPERSVHFRTTLWLTCSGQNYQKNKLQQKESNVPLGKFKSKNQIDRAWDSEIHQPYESWKSWTFSKLSDESAEENFLQKQLRLNFTLESMVSVSFPWFKAGWYHVSYQFVKQWHDLLIIFLLLRQVIN